MKKDNSTNRKTSAGKKAGRILALILALTLAFYQPLTSYRVYAEEETQTETEAGINVGAEQGSEEGYLDQEDTPAFVDGALSQDETGSGEEGTEEDLSGSSEGEDGSAETGEGGEGDGSAETGEGGEGDGSAETGEGGEGDGSTETGEGGEEDGSAETGEGGEGDGSAETGEGGEGDGSAETGEGGEEDGSAKTGEAGEEDGSAETGEGEDSQTADGQENGGSSDGEEGAEGKDVQAANGQENGADPDKETENGQNDQEASGTDEQKEDGESNKKTVEKLKAVPDTSAESVTEYLGEDAAKVNERGWSAAICYVNQADARQFTAEANFTLKYQIEFRNSRDIPAGAVEIRVPVSLVKYIGENEEQTEVPPSAVGVPEALKAAPKEDERTLFNYYTDEQTKELVFYNYADIPANTASAWQVLYRDVDITKDLSADSWSVAPAVAVNNEGTVEKPEENEIAPVAGSIKVPEENTQDEQEETGSEGEPEEEEIITAEEGFFVPEEREGLMSVKTLMTVPDDAAEATIEYTVKKSNADADSDDPTDHADFWTYDIYYVNQGDSHYVYKTDDFSLKYQMEFNASVDIDPGDVEIRIPRALIYYGHGDETRKAFNPQDIGIPMGTPDSPKEARKSSFNYYVDEETDELVFFNYEKIVAGTKNAWQVLTRNVDVMEVEDGFSWEVMPTVTVQVKKNDEEKVTQTLAEEEITPLYGEINTHIELQTTTKVAYSSGASYTPGLYTQKQVLKYAPGAANVVIPGTEDKLFDHFEEYVYVVWKVEVKGYANQPYNLNLYDSTSAYTYDPSTWSSRYSEDMFFVGISDGSTSLPFVYPDAEYGYYGNVNVSAISYSKSRDMKKTYYVVTAYPKSDVVPNYSTVYNNITAQMVPYDGKDNTQSRDANAQWNYVDYQWRYRGDIIDVDKFGTPDILNSWLTVDELISDEQALTTSNFSVKGTCRSFKLTHYLDSYGNWTMGDYMPGTYAKVTTFDDFVYAYPAGGDQSGNYYVLGKEDYFFNKVTVRIDDNGYDVFEDEPGDTVPVSETEGIDRDLHVFAMFADNDADEWEEVAVIPWDANGRVSYTFTAAQIAREPWRVKIEHNSVDYVTYSYIDTNISIRGSSPAFKEFRNTATSVTLENICGITGEYFVDGESRGYFHDSRIEGDNYSEPELADRTEDLYDILLQRDNKMITLKRETMHAHAAKAGEARNDQSHGRARIRYSMEASEGYLLYSQEAIQYLKQYGKATPHRSEVVFYDLLPYGVQLDPSGSITAGRIMSPSITNDVSDEGTWDKKQVTVTVDPSVDVIQNYNGTGRTLVAFHISYSGRDSASYSGGEWFSGFGLAFDAYCEYEDYSAAAEQPNVVAFMPGKEDHKDILGEESEVSLDDGVVVSSDGFAEYYKGFGSDINKDGITTSRNVLYAESNVFTDIAIATEAGIEKLVRAEDDPFGTYKKSTSVLPGMQYEYRITVTNASEFPLEQLVIFDRLENAINDRQEQEPGAFDESLVDGVAHIWKGTLSEVNTSEAEVQGASPVIWYNSNIDAALPSEGQLPSDVLTGENGWIKASEWSGSIDEVQAVAVDLSGGNFQLDQEESVSVSLYMAAPDEMPQDPTAVWTYNNPSFYSVNRGTGNAALTVGNSVKAKLTEAKTLELEKDVDDDTPSQRLNDRFRFYLSWNDGTDSQPFAYKEYSLYEKDKNGQWALQTGLRATDAEGSLYLTRQQKAVFQDVDADMIEIREEESLRWKLEDTDLTGTTENGVRSVKAVNIYRPLLYFRKNVEGYTDADISSVNLQEFRVRLTDASGNPVANEPVLVVKRALTNGDEPQLVANAEHKLYGNLEVPEERPEGERLLMTDENGVFSIYAGETVVVRASETGAKYTFTELEECYSEDTDWICKEPETSATVPANGILAQITNNFRWKALKITKTITDAGYSDLSGKEFTFKIYEADDSAADGKGAQVTSFEWQVVDSISAEGDPELWNDPADDGSITAACAGKVIFIINDPDNRVFKAGKEFVVEEVLTGELAEEFKVDSAEKEVSMPIYASAGRTEFKNAWQYRDIEFTKEVITIYPDTDLSMYPFQLFLELSEDGEEYEPAAGKEYTLYDSDGNRIYNYEDGQTIVEDPEQTEIPLVTGDDGSFFITSGQTARFTAIDKTGTYWRAREKADDSFKPVLPALDEEGPYEMLQDGPKKYLYSEYLDGTLDDGEPVKFINGDSGILIIKKQWIADDEVAEQWLSNQTPYVYIIADFDNIPLQVVTSKDAWYQNNYQWWDPQQQKYYTGFYIQFYSKDAYIVLRMPPDLIGDDAYDFENMEYTIREMDPQRNYSSTYYQGYYTYGGTVLSINPDKNEIVETGTPAEKPVVTIENHVKSFGSAVQKRVVGDAVPAGSTLTWRVEQYTGGSWVPAAGVEYTLNSHTFDSMNSYTYDGSGNYYYYNGENGAIPVPAVSGTTGSDGLIQFVTDKNFYPYEWYYENNNNYTHSSVAYVLFDRVVYVNHYQNPAEGDYRVVEVAGQTDDEWGSLVAYTITPVFDNNYYYENPTGIMTGFNAALSPDSSVATGFVNSTKQAKITVKKVVDEPTDQVFTFILTQYLNLLSNEETSPGAQLPYVVYDTETGEVIREGVTTYDGKLTLQGGQYAEIVVPPSSRWRITEMDSLPYYLDSLEVSGSEVDPDGNGADLSLLGDMATVVKSDMIRYDFTNGVGQLMSKIGASGPVTKVVFGKNSDYPGVISDQYAIMDSKYFGTIRGYLQSDGNGGYVFYVLADDLMYTNTSCYQMFYNGNSVKEIVFDNVSTEKTVDMSYMFYGCNNLQYIRGLENFDTSNVRNMQYMFGYCRSLQALPLSGFVMKDVNVGYMFYYANLSALSTIALDTSQLRSLNYMFYDTTFDTMNLSSWDVSNVESFSNMFSYSSFNSLDLTGWDVSGPDNAYEVNMYYMFNRAGNSGSVLDVSGWDMSKAYTYYMFYYTYIGTINADNWNIGSKTSINMFQYGRMINLSVKNWTGSGLTSLGSVFSECRNLKTITGLDTWANLIRNVSSMGSMFYYCSALETLDLSAWSVSRVTDMSNMFNNCTSLKTLAIDTWERTTAYLNVYRMFYNCYNLETIFCNYDWSTASASSNGMFYYCSKLDNYSTSTSAAGIQWAKPGMNFTAR